MKFINYFLELITSPFSLLLRAAGSGKRISSIKPIFIFLIAIIIVALLVLYFYRDFIFKL